MAFFELIGIDDLAGRHISVMMKARKSNADTESRDVLLREYFLNASLLALLNRASAEAGRLREQKEARLEVDTPPVMLG